MSQLPHSTPVFIFFGNVGSGKTVVLEALQKFERRRKRRVVVISQGIGDFNADAALLRAADENVVEVNAPSGRPTFERWRDALTEAIRRTPDAAFVEIIGQSPAMERAVLRDIIRAGREVGAPTQSVILTLSSENDAPEEDADRLAVCDAVLLTKADRVSPERIDALRARLRERAPHAALFVARNGRPEGGAEWRFGAQGVAPPAGDVLARFASDAAPDFALEAVTLPTRRVLHRDKFTAFLSDLAAETVYVKGFAEFFDEGGVWMIRRQAGVNFIRPVELRTDERFLTVIGKTSDGKSPFDPQTLAAALSTCEAGRRKLAVL
jgi:G3E family GTPase